MIGLSLVVGLLSGASYVNNNYELLNGPTFKGLDREPAINLGAFCGVAGITMATITSLVLDNTVLSMA
jgi:hypothetical protein